MKQMCWENHQYGREFSVTRSQLPSGAQIQAFSGTAATFQLKSSSEKNILNN